MSEALQFLGEIIRHQGVHCRDDHRDDVPGEKADRNQSAQFFLDAVSTAIAELLLGFPRKVNIDGECQENVSVENQPRCREDSRDVVGAHQDY